MIRKTNLCVVCGYNKHNDLNYNHEKDEINDECGFIHKEDLCLFGRKYGDLIFKNFLNDKNNENFRN